MTKKNLINHKKYFRTKDFLATFRKMIAATKFRFRVTWLAYSLCESKTGYLIRNKNAVKIANKSGNLIIPSEIVKFSWEFNKNTKRKRRYYTLLSSPLLAILVQIFNRNKLIDLTKLIEVLQSLHLLSLYRQSTLEAHLCFTWKPGFSEIFIDMLTFPRCEY